MHHRAFDHQHLELSTATLNIRNMKLAEKNSMNTTGKKESDDDVVVVDDDDDDDDDYILDEQDYCYDNDETLIFIMLILISITSSISFESSNQYSSFEIILLSSYNFIHYHVYVIIIYSWN
jgi:hypothetical protein